MLNGLFLPHLNPESYLTDSLNSPLHHLLRSCTSASPQHELLEALNGLFLLHLARINPDRPWPKTLL